MDLTRLVPLTLDRERHLLLNLPAIMLAERELQRLHGDTFSVLEIFAPGFRTLTLHELRIIIWASCLHEDPTVQLETLFAGQPLSRLGDCARAFRAVLGESLLPVDPEAVPGAEERNGDGPLAPSTGPGFGPSDGLSLASSVRTGED